MRAATLALAAGLSALAGAVPAGAAELHFSPVKGFAAGGAPSDVVVGDLDHDGTPDLAVSDETGAKAWLLRGNGDGTFQKGQGYTVGASAISIAIGNLRFQTFSDGRPKLDLITADLNASTLSVLANQGGTFQSRSIVTTHTNPEDVAVGHLHDDPIPDVAFVTAGTDEVGVLVNDHNAEGPNGTLHGPFYYATGDDPAGLATADFDGDFVDDVVTANSAADGVSLLANGGAGSLGSHADYAAGDTPIAIATGDFNNDFATDVAVADAGSGHGVSTLLGNGAGSLQAAHHEAMTDTPSGIAVGDMNADGKLDVVTADSKQNRVSILPGRGNGQFDAARTFPSRGSAGAVAIADLNADGAPDLALSGFTTSDAAVLLALPAARLTPALRAFAPQELGMQGPVKTVTIANRGVGALRVRQLVVAGAGRNDFAVVSSTCGTALHANATCTVGVRFTPLVAGTRRAELRVVDNAAGSPHRVPLRGDGASEAGPDVSGFELRPRRFRARTAKAVPTGSRFAFSLSERGSVRITIARLVAGHRKGGRCVKGATKIASRRCDASVPAGGIDAPHAAQGPNRIPFTGRVGGHALKAGRYRATLRATGLTGRRSHRARAGFTIAAR